MTAKGGGKKGKQVHYTFLHFPITPLGADREDIEEMWELGLVLQYLLAEAQGWEDHLLSYPHILDPSSKGRSFSSSTA